VIVKTLHKDQFKRHWNCVVCFFKSNVLLF